MSQSDDDSSPKSNWSDSTTNVKDMTFDGFITYVKEGAHDYQIDEILEAHPEYANGRDENGKTPLILVAEKGHGDAVDDLINPGRGASYVVDVSITDKDGKTAAQHYEQFFKDNPGEQDEEGVKFFLDIFEKAAKDKTRKPTPSTYDRYDPGPKTGGGRKRKTRKTRKTRKARKARKVKKSTRRRA